MRSVQLVVALSCIAAQSLATAEECSDCEPRHMLAVDLVYTGEVWRNASGGIATGNRYLDNVDLTLDLDGELAFGIEGLRVFGYVLYDNGHALAGDLVGAAQGVSNIEATRALRLYELWTEWQFGPLPGSVRMGLYDLNSEFDAIETAGLFLNPSHGIGPDFSQSGENGPSIFPVTSLAIRASTQNGPWTLQGAVLDGVPGDPAHPDRTSVRFASGDGALLVGEVSYARDSGARGGIGYWRYTGEFDDLLATDADGAPLGRNDNSGAYVFFESPTLFSPANDRGLRVYARTGFANEHVNPVERYYGGGAVYSGLVASRPDDQLGVSLAIAGLGDSYRRAMANVGIATLHHEAIVELTYRFSVAEWLTLQPDVQYIRHPGMDPTLESSWAFGVRFELAHGWRR